MSTFFEKLKRVFSQLLRLLPLLCMAAAAIWFLSSGRHMTIEDMLNYTPTQPLLAALFMLLAFALKSMTLLFPVMLLFAVSGRLFSLPVALLVNTLGIAITVSLPYFIGSASGADLTQQLMVKYPKLAQLRAMRQKNKFFFAFLVRAIGVLPCDVVSLYLGNTRLPYPQYILGSVLGFMPDLLCATILGMKISDMDSPWFWLTLGINLIFCTASFFIYRAYVRKLKPERKEAVCDE